MLWICGQCTSSYWVGAERCPQCGSTEYYEEGDMPKTTVYGGASYDDVPRAQETPEVPSETSDEEFLEDLQAGEPPYDALLRDDLRALLAERELPTSGNKDELVARLVADDEAEGEEAEVEEPE